MPISIKSKNEIELMREAGLIVAKTHELLKETIEPGISTWELDKIAEDFIKSHNAKPSFKGYSGFPASIQVILRESNAIPSKNRILKDGDIISIDIGAFYNGYHGDAARTLAIGNISDEASKLIKVTEESFYKGIELAKEGCHLFEISAAIQAYVEAYGYSVVRDLVGHGIGRKLHEEPQIPNFKQKGRGPKLEAGMVLAIEPMINMGRYEVRWLDDDWTVVTMDGSLSAHYENTVLITEEGYELLTKI